MRGVSSRRIVPYNRRGASISRSVYLPLSAITHSRNSPAYILYNGVMTGPFAANEKAIRNINGIPHLLCERATTQIPPYSEQMEDHLDNRITFDNNSGAAPDGSVTADTIIPTAVSGTHRIYTTGWTSDGSSDYTHFICCKSNGYKYIKLRLIGGFSTIGECIFNLDTGVVDTPTACTSGLVSVGNYYLAWITATSDLAVGSAESIVHVLNDSKATSFTGDGTSGVDCWGWNTGKVEWVGSYIKTVATSETRLATNAYVDTGDVPTWLRNKFRLSWVPNPMMNQSSQDHVLCQMRDSAEDFDLYYKGSTGEVIVEGSVSGVLLTKSAITLADEHVDPVLFDFTLDNGSVCSLTVSSDQSGFSGGGTQAGSAAVSYDGVFYIGAENTLVDCADGLVGVIQL